MFTKKIFKISNHQLHCFNSQYSNNPDILNESCYQVFFFFFFSFQNTTQLTKRFHFSLTVLNNPFVPCMPCLCRFVLPTPSLPISLSLVKKSVITIRYQFYENKKKKKTLGSRVRENDLFLFFKNNNSDVL